MLTLDEFAQMIDHAVLGPSQTDTDLEEGVRVARKYRVKCFCPNPYQLARARELLQGSDVQLCCPIGFPQGVTLPEVKQFEAETALKLGARELDMTINVGALKARRYDLVEQDIAGVVEVARRFGASVKTIIETCLLTDDEKVAACQIAERAGALFIKTSTGCQAGGATVEDVRLLRAAVGPNVVIKASGQVSDIEKALALYEAGARRFGTSSTVSILEGLRRKIEEQSRG